jgi:hypothetical protein
LRYPFEVVGSENWNSRTLSVETICGDSALPAYFVSIPLVNSIICRSHFPEAEVLSNDYEQRIRKDDEKYNLSFALNHGEAEKEYYAGTEFGIHFGYTLSGGPTGLAVARRLPSAWEEE